MTPDDRLLWILKIWTVVMFGYLGYEGVIAMIEWQAK